MRRRPLLSAAGLAVPIHLLTRLDDALALMPAAPGKATPAEFTRRIARARCWFDNGDLAQLVGELPALLAISHEAAEHHGDPAAYAQVAACYDLATETLNKIGRYQASRITADRATARASRSGSSIAIAAAARSLGIVLRHDAPRRHREPGHARRRRET